LPPCNNIFIFDVEADNQIKMKVSDKIKIVFLLLSLAAFSSCGLFKKGSKCGDCPVWGKNQVQSPSSRS
jgi:hypothetical protein